MCELAVGMRMFIAVGIGKQGWVRRTGGAVQLVTDVVVLVPNDQVGVAALARVVTAAIGIRSALVIAFNHGVRWDRHRDDITFAGIIINGGINLGGAVAMDDVVGNAVQRAGAVGGTIRAPIGVNGD